MDPHLDMIPQSLINFIMKNVIGVILKFIQKKGQKLPQVYHDLMAEKKDFYDEVFRRVCSALDQVESKAKDLEGVSVIHEGDHFDVAPMKIKSTV